MSLQCKRQACNFRGQKRGEFPSFSIYSMEKVQKSVEKYTKSQLGHWNNKLYCSSNENLKNHAVAVIVKSLSVHDFCQSLSNK